MAFEDMYKEMLNWLPVNKSPFFAKKLINDAWRRIQDEREWSFLLAEGTLVSPGILTSGQATFTQYSTTVTLDSTASAAVTGLTNPLITKRQIRAGSTSAGAIYSIVAADFSVPTAVVLTLDRIFTETGGAQGFQIYRCYYEPVDLLGNPTTEFKYWLGVKVPTIGYTIAGPNLYRTQEEISLVDPQRAASGQPYWVCSYKADPLNNFAPLYELWPHPTANLGMPTLYVRRAADFSANSDRIPYQLSERLFIAKALSLLAEWADFNRGQYPELQKTNWTQVKSNREAEYQAQLFELKKQDNSQFITNWIVNPLRGFWGPYDSNFWQSHDVALLPTY